MKTTFKKSLITTSILAGLYGTSASYAMTIDESTIMGGDFSNDFMTPTDLPGATGVTGMFGVSIMDTTDSIRFTDLPTGIQTFKLVSTAEMGAENHYLSISQNVNTFVTLFNVNIDQDTSFQTLADFDGNLNLWFFVEGLSEAGKVTYSIELQPVPVPAAALLFASGLGALGAAKARRKAKRRA